MSIQEIITIITSILFGGGWLLQIIKGRQEKKKREAEADVASADAESKAVQTALDSSEGWIRMYEKEEQRRMQDKTEFLERIAALKASKEKKDILIDEQRRKISEQHDIVFALKDEISQLKVRAVGMSIKICEIKGCEKRKPQTGY